MIRKHLKISQQQLAKATNLTQPAISRLENGEEVYASALLAVLDFYREKINMDYLLDPDVETENNTLLYCNSHEFRQRIDHQLAIIANDLDKSHDKIAALRKIL
jgi:transcriptional regulator with XRE-family HTH domain